MPISTARFPRLLLAIMFAFALVVASLPTAGTAAAGKQLRRVRGNVGYQTGAAAPLTPIFGKIDLPDDSIAVTEVNSVAELALPDSSVVTLGAGTHVQVGAFNTTADGPGSTIVVSGGTLRFDIKRPVGGHANYQFQTATSQIAVRGTIGLLSFINGITTVGCVQCAADSVVVTTGGQTFALATGQILTVSAAGVAVPGALSATTTAAFGSAGVGTGAGAGAGAGAAVGAAAAGAAAAGVAAASIIKPGATNSPSTAPTSTPSATPSTTPSIAPSASPAPTLTPSASPSASPSPSSSPVPSASPTASSSPVATATPTSAGNVVITSKRRTEASAAPAAPAAPSLPSRPAPGVAAPAPPDLPGHPARGSR